LAHCGIGFPTSLYRMIQKIAKKLFLFLILVFCFSCEKQGFFIDCHDCIAKEPLKTNLEIKLDNNFYGFATIIKVYEGNLEDSVLYSSYNASGKSTTITVSINKKYTVTAIYYIPGVYYIAVDSATPRVKYEKDQCNDPCYFVYDRVIDLRVKYTK
jgi:hypothetical protein